MVVFYIISLLVGFLYIYFSRKPDLCFMHLDATVINILAWTPVVFYLYYYKITWVKLVAAVLLGVAGLVFYVLYFLGLLTLLDYKNCKPNYLTSYASVSHQVQPYECRGKQAYIGGFKHSSQLIS